MRQENKEGKRNALIFFLSNQQLWRSVHTPKDCHSNLHLAFYWPGQFQSPGGQYMEEESTDYNLTIVSAYFVSELNYRYAFDTRFCKPHIRNINLYTWLPLFFPNETLGLILTRGEIDNVAKLLILWSRHWIRGNKMADRKSFNLP